MRYDPLSRRAAELRSPTITREVEMSVEEAQELHFGSLDAPPSAELLRQCQGFLVGSTDGRVGTAQVLRRPSATASETLSSFPVLAGRSSRILLLIPLGEIESVLFAEKRIIVRASPKIVATERLAHASRRSAEAMLEI
jgi:hypothetical protein